MPLLGFQKQFADLVERGEKRQTIRAFRKDGRDPRVGDLLHLYTGPHRPGQRRKIGRAECTSVARILIGSAGSMVIERADWRLWQVLDDERRQIAQADGFESADEMVAWFEKAYGLPFEGLLIRWGDIER